MQALREVDPDVAVIGFVDDPAAEAEVRAWAADGVRGLVPRDVDATSLGRAVIAAARGEVLVFGGLLEQLSLTPTVSTLTQRESEVRELLEVGLADKQIATRLGISVKTVEKHVGAVLRKENARSRTELVARQS
jgi:DNA-binding NarL/FixJ family response regulator